MQHQQPLRVRRLLTGLTPIRMLSCFKHCVVLRKISLVGSNSDAYVVVNRSEIDGRSTILGLVTAGVYLFSISYLPLENSVAAVFLQ